MISKLIITNDASSINDPSSISVKPDQAVQFINNFLKPATLDAVEGEISLQDSEEIHSFLQNLFLVLKPNG